MYSYSINLTFYKHLRAASCQISLYKVKWFYSDSVDPNNGDEKKKKAQSVHVRNPGAFCVHLCGKIFSLLNLLKMKKNIHNYGGRNLFKKKRSLFRLIGTVSHWKQKQRSSHSPVVIHPKAHSHSLYSPAIKIRLGNKIQKHFRIGIWEKKTKNKKNKCSILLILFFLSYGTGK